MNEIPIYMWSPHPSGKLYKSFVFTAESDKFTQLINFMDYKTFRWVLETKNEKGEYQPLMGVLAKDAAIYVKTNSLLKFNSGDTVYIEHPLFKGVEYFTIDGDIEIKGQYYPKWRQTYQRFVIKPLEYNKINVEREGD